MTTKSDKTGAGGSPKARLKKIIKIDTNKNVYESVFIKKCTKIAS